MSAGISPGFQAAVDTGLCQHPGIIHQRLNGFDTDVEVVFNFIKIAVIRIDDLRWNVAAADPFHVFSRHIQWTDDGILTFSLGSQQGSPSMPPLVISGRALPSVPVSHRPVFQIVELRAVRTNDVLSWLKDSLKVEGVVVSEDARRNAITLQGRPSAVAQIVAAIQVLDRPTLKGSFSRRLEPAFLTAADLATQLSQAMNAQGYAATMTLDGLANAILILPITSNNSVLVFASSQSVLEHVLSWARTIDRPNLNQGQNGLFYYQVKNTRAGDLATVLGVQGASSASQGRETAPATASTAAPSQPSAAARQAAMPSASQGLGTSGQMVVDEPRNALVFRGNPTEWEQLLPLIKQMDRAPRQVMVEVTIAEVSLDGSTEFGLSWFAKDSPGRFNGAWNFGTIGGDSGDGNSGGLSYLLDIAGQNRAQLRAFADDQRVSILSTPRLMVKSGGTASIDVGTEVPLITQQTTSDQQTDGNTNLLQSIQYRKTGILLEISPIIYSDNRIDLEIVQEVSEALPVPDGTSVPSPSIFNRSLSTSLSLRDGGSVVLGGLISERETAGNSGIPGLKDVPVLGNLFKTQGKQTNKTELVILIVPYIIEENDDAQRIARAVADELTLLQLPSGVSNYVPEDTRAPSNQE